VRTFCDLDIVEGRPIGSQTMDYTLMTLKSIRILNRLKDYLTEHQIDVSFFMDSILTTKTVLTRTSNTEVQICKAKKFFIKLQQSKIRKSL
jgi:hypothetical protein